MIPILSPGHSVGPFGFGEHINPYLKRFDFEIETIGERDPTTYYSPGREDEGISITLDEKECIESIFCRQELQLYGANLIGMSLRQFEIHSGASYVGVPDSLNWEEDDIPQIVYEFESLGLQVWVKHNVIVTIIASALWED
jgi:hypothetical protein